MEREHPTKVAVMLESIESCSLTATDDLEKHQPFLSKALPKPRRGWEVSFVGDVLPLVSSLFTGGSDLLLSWKNYGMLLEELHQPKMWSISIPVCPQLAGIAVGGVAEFGNVR
jgi:hypothetical protein